MKIYFVTEKNEIVSEIETDGRKWQSVNFCIYKGKYYKRTYWNLSMTYQEIEIHIISP